MKTKPAKKEYFHIFGLCNEKHFDIIHAMILKSKSFQNIGLSVYPPNERINEGGRFEAFCTQEECYRLRGFCLGVYTSLTETHDFM